MTKQDFLGLGNYLKKINDSFDEKKSMTDILDSFRCVSKEYQEFSSLPEQTEHYSNVEFSKCSEEEQNNFINSELEVFESLVCNSIYDRQGILWSWAEIFDLIHDPIYKSVEKSARKVVYSAGSNSRPVGDVGYATWNGLQIIDLDIKNKEIADALKPLIFNDLCKFHWFLGICNSASGKSLHVWTKVNPITSEIANRKVEFLCNFRHKYSYIYIALLKYAEKFGYDKEKIFDYMDMAMAKPSQGIFITSDDNAMMSTNFRSLRLDVDFSGAFDTGISSVNWISHPDLKHIFAKLEWFNNDKFNDMKNVEIKDLSNINDRDMSKTNKKHYKHNQRWQLANTLTAIYGYEKALQIMVQICSGTDYGELKGDVKTASIHSKPVSVWAVNELNKYHGFKIKMSGTETKAPDVSVSESENPIENLDPVQPEAKGKMVELHISKNQYLGDIKDQIMANLSQLTLLEAGAGYGKTEMIKALSAKTLLILPFTSTIKAKVESSKTTEDWLYYYGSKRPSLDDLLGSHSMSMTIDKFSRLNVMELDMGQFEYIVLDESHLLFTSSYRDVMSPTIQRLANCKAKIILMTGTPTGELLFFPNITHIKVIKEDVRQKKFDVHFCQTDIEQRLKMCECMAEDIMSGKKILFPTNKGTEFKEETTGLIQQFLNKAKYDKPLNSFYYKKSNFNDESMDAINIEKTIGNNDIVFCTNYLSVGVDICDKYVFSVYFDQQWIPQDIEQFANRLRNNDLFIKMFLPKMDHDVPINYYFTQSLDLSFNKKDLLFARDLIKTCNDMIQRNADESKYNPIIQSLLSANKYLKYDENDCKYYIDETTYKLNVFEERYSAYSKQLEVLMKGIRYYGYEVEVIDHPEIVPEDRAEKVKEYIKSCKNSRFNYITNQTMEFLENLSDSNIEIYKEIMSGNYDVFKNDKYVDESGDNNLYIKDIEILEKNTPIVVSLYKFYDCETIRDIYDFCIDKKINRINYSKLNKIRKFVNIEYNIRKKRLDFPVLKFVREAQDWAERSMAVKKEDINEFLRFWAAKYANSIPDVVVDDIQFLDQCLGWVTELFKIVVVQERPKNGIIKVAPFRLLWESKESLASIYGNATTKDFFLRELIDNLKVNGEKPETKVVEEVEKEFIPDLPHTRKYKLEDIEHELVNVVHKEFDYYDYSKQDDSNNRFMVKQTNTSQLRDALLGKLNNPIEEIKEDEEPDLFNDPLDD
jgi:hypothetical protein